MGKLTAEQAKKMMEAVNNAETNPIDDKFYPKNKITTADKIDTGEPRPLPSKKKKKMPGITGKVKQMTPSQGPSDPSIIFNIKGKEYKVINRKSGSKKAEKKMPKARDMAMGNKNISYVGDPFIVDGKVFDPAKEFPEDYMRPEGAKTFSMGGDADACGCASCMGESSKGAGAAVRGTKFKGIF